MIVDIQTSLAKAVSGGDACIDRAAFLIEAARALEVPVLASEQYPERLGGTVDALAALLDPEAIHPKLTFAGSGDERLRGAVQAAARPQLVLAGMEAHVCVLQTALGFKTLGLEPVVVADAVASRAPSSRERALARLQGAGVPVVTSEMVVFEWLERAGTPAFKSLLPLIRDRGEA
ncbi:MAG: isochorismatase family protein [Geminicoccaceae bacterium]|nr:isochorismatase family protein [Geminicoccaceae bacterium]